MMAAVQRSVLTILVIGLFVLIAVAMGSGGRSGQPLQSTTLLEASKEDTVEPATLQAAEVVRRVRRHIALPKDPQPTVAAIVDVEQLRAKNAFYEQAQNGDYLILTADRAMLYRPTEDKILDMVHLRQ